MSNSFKRSVGRGLAIETTSRAGSIALAASGVVVEELPLDADRRHASGLMPAIAAALAARGWTPTELDHIYVSIGPGSFTGIRVAVSIARAYAQITGCTIVAVPTVDVIATNAPAEAREVLIALDAKRGEIFGARFTRNPAGVLERVEGPALVFPADLLARCARPVHLLGEGIDFHRAALLPAGENGIIETDRTLWRPRAAAVLAIGWRSVQAGALTPPETLLPTYIRLAEAEEVWRKKHGVPL